MCESMFDPQQTVIAKGSVLAQDRAPVAARKDYWGQHPMAHEKRKLVRSCVIRCLTCVGTAQGDQEVFVERSNGPAKVGGKGEV